MGNPGSPEDETPLDEEEVEEGAEALEPDPRPETGDEGGGGEKPDYKYGG